MKRQHLILLLFPVVCVIAVIPFLAQDNADAGSCDNFRLLNPSQVRDAPTGYEWSSVAEADTYRVQFVRGDDLIESYDVFAPQTQIYLDVTNLIGQGLQWRVAALADSEILCSTPLSAPISEIEADLQNCMDFRIIAPETVFSYEVTYSWSTVSDADAYKVLFWRRDNDDNVLAAEFVVDAPETSLQAALGVYPTGSKVQWEVLALKAGSILCSTGRTAIADRIIRPEPTALDEESDEGGQGTLQPPTYTPELTETLLPPTLILSFTPSPAPTETALPPTATPVPPTDTLVPPSDTPTNTPTPTFTPIP